MTPRVWVERPIESVEDAEASEYAAHPDGRRAARLAVSDVPWRVTPPADASPNAPRVATDADMIGWTALVPVEAVEEMRPAEVYLGALTEAGAEFNDRTGEPIAYRRRLCTPWGDAN